MKLKQLNETIHNIKNKKVLKIDKKFINALEAMASDLKINPEKRNVP